MPVFNIYLEEQFLESVEFNYRFLVLANQCGKLSWATDDEHNENGVIIFWISSDYNLHSISPESQITVDGIQFERKFYMDVDLRGKYVIFEHGNYKLICKFPGLVE